MTPWTAAHKASLSFSISRSLLKFTTIELVMPSFLVSQPFASGDQSIRASVLASFELYSPKLNLLKPKLLLPQNLTLFGTRTVAYVISQNETILE